jgi:hypothetical protein
MADIFISWGSPEKEAVEPLVRRLDDSGLDFFEYTDMMRSGRITVQVLEEIHKAKLALFLFSDSSVTREWFRRELDWCYSDECDSSRPMKDLVFANVGSLTIDRLPDLIQGRFVYDFNAKASYEMTLCRLIQDIHRKLGYKELLVIPATVFAMTSDEARELNRINYQLEQVSDLYRQAGIGQEEDWGGSFSSRYGKTPEAFAPFSNEATVKDVVQSVLRQVNRGRRKSVKISIQWYDRRLLAANTEAGDNARNDWRRDCHVLFIDAVSLLINSIASDLTSVLSLTRNEMRRALVWIPPYTRHAGHLQNLITQIQKPMPLRSLLQDWQTRPECCVAFDTATNVSLRRWLTYVLRDLSAPPSPLPRNLADLEQNVGRVDITPESMHNVARSEY